MLSICEEFAWEYDMKFNSSKSVAMRIGERYKVKCEPLTLAGSELQFVQSLKYLGVQFVAAKKFACSVENVRVKCYRTFNAIYARSKGAQSEMVTLQLFKSYCLPFMLYATEVMSLSERSLKSLDYCVRQIVAKVFSVQDNNCIAEIRAFCDLPYIGVLIERRRLKFVEKLVADEQLSYLFRLRLH